LIYVAGLGVKERDLRVGVFAYNFKHWKTQAGIQNLCIAGYKPVVLLAADPVELKFYRSKVRIAPRDTFLWHPKELAKFYGIDYRVLKHNSQMTSDIVRSHNLDVGVVLGARILKPIAFNHFNIGVLNMHPGILPQNRGLDTIKWAILKDMPQGVTGHLIDGNIDRGFLIKQEEIAIYKDDTLVDLQVRIQNLEQRLMIDSLNILSISGGAPLDKLPEGTYHKSVPVDIEKGLELAFTKYKEGRCV